MERWVLVVLGGLAGALLTGAAGADTVYLKDGRSMWGQEVRIEGDEVVLLRPGQTLRFPRSQVDRIEEKKTTLPLFYEPPSAEQSGAGGASGGPTGVGPGAGLPTAPPSGLTPPPPPPPVSAPPTPPPAPTAGPPGPPQPLPGVPLYPPTKQ